jgi:Zn finger protein HypA/HybF involved in hydrogenase expression
MSWIEVFCKSPRCRASFKVDEDVPSTNCHKCGTLHSSPWEEHDPRLEPPEDNHPPVLTCEGCFAEFDVRREPVSEYQTNLYRCPKCGRDHSEKRLDADAEPDVSPADAAPETPVVADGGESAVEVIDQLPDALDERTNGGDVHIHFHQDG